MENLLLFICVIAGTFISINTKCPKDWAEVGRTGEECLYFSYEKKTWSDAQALCRTKFAYLATDDNKDKHNFIRQAISVLDGEGLTNFYIGGNDQVIEGNWRWLETGMPLSGFTAWAPGQPSNNISVAVKNNCMMLQFVGDDLYWNEWPCNDRRAHFICERPAASFANGPVIG